MNNTKYTKYVILLHKIPDLETKLETIQRHVEHLKKLDNDGTLVMCGPFTDFPSGMVVVSVPTKDYAEKIAKEDPFVAEGVRTYEVRTWLLACAENNYLA